MKFNFKAILIFILLIGFILPIFGFCQEEDLIQEPKLKAVAGKDRNIVVNRKIVFSAIGSVTENVSKVEYNWDFGDGYKGQGEEVTHVYNNSGVYRVKLNMKADSEAGQLKNSDEIIVNVDKDIFVLISDNEVSEEELKTISDMASSQGILVADIKEAEDSAGYIAEKELADKIIKNKEDIRQAGSIVIWTKQDLGLNALLETAQSLSKNDTSFGFNNKYFVVITDQNFTVTAKLAQSLYNILEPQFIVLARPEAKNKIFSNSDLNSLLQDLRKDNSEYRLLGLHSKREASELKPWNFLSFFVGFMVDRGVPLNTIYLILILPVIATVMAFSRQIIGLKAL
ncbi:MAG TPA: PKD domain-containing protein, partial [Patescibacteria group bacterium]|nr:PKD domain-containing protein [Patescibacteria group bacterium]